MICAFEIFFLASSIEITSDFTNRSFPTTPFGNPDHLKVNIPSLRPDGSSQLWMPGSSWLSMNEYVPESFIFD